MVSVANTITLFPFSTTDAVQKGIQDEQLYRNNRDASRILATMRALGEQLSQIECSLKKNQVKALMDSLTRVQFDKHGLDHVVPTDQRLLEWTRDCKQLVEQLKESIDLKMKDLCVTERKGESFSDNEELIKQAKALIDVIAQKQPVISKEIEEIRKQAGMMTEFAVPNVTDRIVNIVYSLLSSTIFYRAPPLETVKDAAVDDKTAPVHTNDLEKSWSTLYEACAQLAVNVSTIERLGNLACKFIEIRQGIDQSTLMRSELQTAVNPLLSLKSGYIIKGEEDQEAKITAERSAFESIKENFRKYLIGQQIDFTKVRAGTKKYAEEVSKTLAAFSDYDIAIGSHAYEYVSEIPQADQHQEQYERYLSGMADTLRQSWNDACLRLYFNEKWIEVYTAISQLRCKMCSLSIETSQFDNHLRMKVRKRAGSYQDHCSWFNEKEQEFKVNFEKITAIKADIAKEKTVVCTIKSHLEDLLETDRITVKTEKGRLASSIALIDLDLDDSEKKRIVKSLNTFTHELKSKIDALLEKTEQDSLALSAIAHAFGTNYIWAASTLEQYRATALQAADKNIANFEKHYPYETSLQLPDQWEDLMEKVTQLSVTIFTGSSRIFDVVAAPARLAANALNWGLSALTGGSPQQLALTETK